MSDNEFGPMKAGQLKEILEDVPDDYEIYMNYDEYMIQMNFKIRNANEISKMFTEVQNRLFNENPDILYVVYNMGSSILDTSNPKNYVQVTSDFTEIYNDDTKELTFMRNKEIKGFIFESKTEPFNDEVEE